MGEIFIDGLGVIYLNGEPIGYYDQIDDLCFLNNGDEIECPPIDQVLNVPTVTAKKTYWWVLLLGFVVVVLLVGWLVNRE